MRHILRHVRTRKIVQNITILSTANDRANIGTCLIEQLNLNARVPCNIISYDAVRARISLDTEHCSSMIFLGSRK